VAPRRRVVAFPSLPGGHDVRRIASSPDRPDRLSTGRPGRAAGPRRRRRRARGTAARQRHRRSGGRLAERLRRRRRGGRGGRTGRRGLAAERLDPPDTPRRAAFSQPGQLRPEQRGAGRRPDGAGLRELDRHAVQGPLPLAPRVHQHAARALRRRRHPRARGSQLRGGLEPMAVGRGPAARPRGVGAAAVLRHQQHRPRHPPARHEQLHGPAGAQRLRQLAHAAGRGDPAPGHGLLPQHAALGQGGPGRGHAPQRELRPRGLAAVLHRPAQAQPRRHAAARWQRPYPGDLRRAGGQGFRARLHGLELRRPGHHERARLPLPGRERRGAVAAPDAELAGLPRTGREAAAGRPAPARRTRRCQGPERRARRDLQPPQCGAVFLPATHPAPDHQQPEPDLCEAGGRCVRQQRAAACAAT
jgi:hypothetical protein